jgi:hypothetical protein
LLRAQVKPTVRQNKDMPFERESWTGSCGIFVCYRTPADPLAPPKLGAKVDDYMALGNSIRIVRGPVLASSN